MSTNNDKISIFFEQEEEQVLWYFKPLHKFSCSKHLPENFKRALKDYVETAIEAAQSTLENEFENDQNLNQQQIRHILLERNECYPVMICKDHAHWDSEEDDIDEECENENQRWIDVKMCDILDQPKCGVCAFQKGIQKLRNVFETTYKRRVLEALEENWVAPRADGSCPYAEWSWRKMQRELMFNFCPQN